MSTIEGCLSKKPRTSLNLTIRHYDHAARGSQLEPGQECGRVMLEKISDHVLAGVLRVCITSSSRGKTDEGKRCHNICDDIDNRANLPDSIHHKLPQVYSSETKLFM